MVKPRSKNGNDKKKTDIAKEEPINIKADINDSEWNCIVIMAVESDEYNTDLITFFQDEAKKNIRPVIKGLTFEALIQKAKKGKGDKVRDKSKDSKSSNNSGKSSKNSGSSKGSKRSVSASQYHTTEDIVGSVLSGLKKGLVPAEPLAKLIKRHILQLKKSDIEQKKLIELLKLENKDDEKVSLLPTGKSDKGRKSTKGKKTENMKKDKTKSPDKKEKKNVNNKDKEKIGKSKKLKEIRDHPALGPNMYFILSGFYDPNLLIEMVKVGIPVRAIISVEENIESTIKEMILSLVDVKTTIQKEIKKTQKPDKPNKAEKIFKFWEELNNVLNKPENKMLTKDLPTIRCMPSVKFKNAEQKNDKLSVAYNEMSYVLYKVYDYWRKYEMYINNMESIKVDDENVLLLESADLYNSLIGSVPLECCTIEIILHCILEQLSWWAEQEILEEDLLNESLEKSDILEVNSKNSESGEIILETPLKENKTPQSFLTNSVIKDQTSGDTLCLKENNVTPILIDSYDITKNKTFHLNIAGCDLGKISSNMFLKSPIIALWDRYPVLNDYKQKLFNYHLQNFKRCCDGFYYDSDYIFKIYLHQMLLQKMMLIQNNLIAYYQYEKDNDYFNEDICNIVLNSGEIMEELMPEEKNIDSGRVFEEENVEFTEIEEVAVDCKDSIENSYKSCTRRGFLTLSDKNNLRKKDMAYLKSFLECNHLKNIYDDIRNLDSMNSDFSDTVKDEIKDLLYVKEMDNKTMAETLNVSFQDFNEVSYDYFSLTDCIILWFHQNKDVQYINHEKSEYKINTQVGFKDFYDLILFKEENILKDIENKINKIRIFSSKENINNKSADFTSEERADNIHNKTQSAGSNNNEFENMKDMKTNKTYCYNLGPSQISFKETTTNCYSLRSTHVQINKTKRMKEKILFGLKVTTFNNSLYFHRLLPASEIESKIYFKTKNDIIISVDLNLFYNKNKSIENKSKGVEENPQKSKSQRTKSQRKTSLLSPVEDLKKGLTFTSEMDSGFNIVLPTGLQIEIVKGGSDLGPFYVRQKYLYKNSMPSNIIDEDYRCYLRNGCVLIFKIDQSVDILYSNSTIIKCKNFKYVVNLNLDSEPEKEVEAGTKRKTIKKDERIRSKSGSKKTRKSVPIKEKKADKKDTTEKPKLKDKKSPKGKGKEKSEEIPQLLPPALKMDTFIISALGECLQTENDIIQSADLFYTLRTAYDPQLCEFYTLRSDGTSCLYVKDSLIVHFPDGTRIKTGCEESINVNIPKHSFDCTEIIKVKKCIDNTYNNSYKTEETEKLSTEEENYKHIDWGIKSANNLFHDLKASEMLEGTLTDSPGVNENVENIEEADMENEEENFEENTDETFDIFTMDCTLEHENYATVNYDNSLKEIILQLPGKISVIIHDDKTIEVAVGKNTNLIINKQEALLVSALSDTVDCMTIFRFSRNEIESDENNLLPEFICETIDSDGNVFLVDRKGEATMFQSNEFPTKKRSNIEEVNSRYFVLHRDLSGYEFLRKDHPMVLELISCQANSVKMYPLLRNTEFSKYLKQTPVLETRSEKYIKKQHKILPVRLKRKDLSKPKIYENLWFPEEMRKDLEITDIYFFNNTDDITPNYNAFIVKSVQQIKNENTDVEMLFNVALMKYISNCTEKYNEYEKHTVEEVRSEGEVLENAKLISEVLRDSNCSGLQLDFICSLCSPTIQTYLQESESFCSTTFKSCDSEKLIDNYLF